MSSTLIGSIGWGISAIITFVLSVILIRAFLKEKNDTLKYFFCFLTSRFFLFSFLTLAPLVYILTRNATFAGIFFSLSYVFMFVSFIFPPLLFLSFQWKKFKKYYFGLVLAVSFLGILVTVSNFSPILADLYDIKGIVSQPTPNILSQLYVLSKIISVLPLSIIFFIFAVKNTGKIRLRSLLMGLGLLWVITTIIIPSILPPLWGGIYCSVADILIFIGVMIKPQEG